MLVAVHDRAHVRRRAAIAQFVQQEELIFTEFENDLKVFYAKLTAKIKECSSEMKDIKSVFLSEDDRRNSKHKATFALYCAFMRITKFF